MCPIGILGERHESLWRSVGGSSDARATFQIVSQGDWITGGLAFRQA
ncbi:hypothetical protein RISK_001611 [Rhodopirellula islandica]|uniref:Uncharacterized protein n=1 Tax=Rhodopirellula islandica TaxID=595434 RepID=A0A0J1BIP0_RHOIS|nr:hypothetical protein RISK_001611 [Rhodopirellula islandica]